MRITALKMALAACATSMEAIIAAAINDDGTPRDLTAEETAAFEGKQAEAKRLEASIAREQAVLDLKASAAVPVQVAANPTPAPVGTVDAGGLRSVPAAVAEKPAPGIMIARLTRVLAANNMDQRAAAAMAEADYGTPVGQIVANMEQSTNTKGGFLVDTVYSADFIDVLRPRVVIRNLGARTVPMAEGNLTMRRKTAGSTAGYIGERVAAPSTDVTVGTLTMSAKTLAALVPITNRLLRRSSISVDAMVRDDLVSSVAVKEDQQFLRGTGSSTAPTGLKNLINASNLITANATVNLVNVTNDLGKLRLAVLNANVPMNRCGYIMSPRTALFLENIRDGNGNKAFPEMAEGRLGIYPVGITTSVPDNLGVGTNKSEVYFGDFDQFLIGDTEQVMIAASDVAAYDDGGTMRAAFSNDETVIRIITEHDTQVRYDTAFAMLSDVAWIM